MNSASNANASTPTGTPNRGSGATNPTEPKGTGAKRRRRRIWKVLLSVFLIYIGTGFYQACLKPLPAGLSLEGAVQQVAAGDVEFLYDVTAMKGGQRVSEQMIFDRALRLIREAQDFVVVDFFLFNPYLGKDSKAHHKLCDAVAGALVETKRTRPAIRMVVITDPINEVYGGPVPPQFKTLREAGIPVVLTDLRKLRDSNPVYSAFWRVCVQWFGTSSGGSLPHPFAKDASQVSLRSWLALLNFKANHRKLIVADAPVPSGGRQLVSMVLSANPHDASSAHSNVGLLVRGGIWRDLLRGEQAVLALSGKDMDLFSGLPAYAKMEGTRTNLVDNGQGVTLQVLTEGKIRRGLLEVLGKVRSGDEADIAMFYLSERSVVRALLDAAERGATIRVLLDPNRDAFGYQKNGIPNRPVAAELMKAGGGKIAVRWFSTHGEQFHTKMVLVKQAGKRTLFTGSANLTRRNIGDFNLETDVVVAGAQEVPSLQAAAEHFERLWANQGNEFSVPYETFAETSHIKYWQYRFQERSGVSSF